MNIYIEIFGYIGTALVLISMMMTSVGALRVVNVAGSVITVIYALLVQAYPVMLLNIGLILINGWQLIRLFRFKYVYHCERTDVMDGRVEQFLLRYGEDIDRYFPNYSACVGGCSEAYIVYAGKKEVGLLLGAKTGETFSVLVEYAVPYYRNRSVAEFLYTFLRGEGIKRLTCVPSQIPRRCRYLSRMGFWHQGDTMVREL